jgi:hypothetical protein
MIAGSENGLNSGRNVVAFNINDRSTWAWTNEAVTDDGNGYSLNPKDKHSFYQFSDGVPYLHQCAMEDQSSRLIYNPELNVCDWSMNHSEAKVYEWAVGRGLVEDQR